MNTTQTWEIVKKARSFNRLTAFDYIEHLFPDFMELHGDRNFGDDPSIVCGFAHFENYPIMLIAQNRGRYYDDMVRCNFGMVRPEGHRKSLRAMNLAEKYELPVISLIDTLGAYMDVDSENRGQASAIAHNLMVRTELRVPMISIIIGQAGSGGALALAVSDRLYMLKNSVYSILSPEGFSMILYKDVSHAKESAQMMKMTAEALLELKVIDGIIDEAKDGNWTNPELTYTSMKDVIRDSLTLFNNMELQEILSQREEKYKSY